MTAIIRTALLALGLAIASGASAAGDAEAALEAARARWQAAGLADYEYGYHKYCDCHRESPPETLVTVRGGQVERVRHRPAGTTTEVLAEDRHVQYYWPVDELFALVGSALGGAVPVRAEYEPPPRPPPLLSIGCVET